jgi:hypothetical protein
MKYTKRRFYRATAFINALFLIYLCVEIFILLQSKPPTSGHVQKSQALSSCDTCSKPDVYLILLDEYFGSAGLKEFYRFDNSAFELSLKEKGFTVLSNTRCNYLLTVFSMASMLNMDYLRNRGDINLKNHYAYKTSLSDIESNAVIEKFRTEGYRINNKSRFDMKGAPTDYSTGLLPAKVQLINSKTLYYRLARNLPAFLAKKFRIRFWAKKIDDRAVQVNQEMMDKVLTEAERMDTFPTFTYMHLHMPHEPIAFDSTGKPVIPFSQRKSISSKDVDEAYLQYLVYTNKTISKYIDGLQKATGGNSVILLMSDHGFRFGSISDKKDMYQTLNAVYLPPVILRSSKDISGKTTTGWYNGMTNVNQFRVLFNTLFDAKLPILKDSIIRGSQNRY